MTEDRLTERDLRAIALDNATRAVEHSSGVTYEILPLARKFYDFLAGDEEQAKEGDAA